MFNNTFSKRRYTFKFRNINDYEEFKEKAKKYIYDGDKLFDGSQTKTKNQKLETNIKILDEKIIHRCGKKESGVRWLQGAHPHIGEIIQGKTGLETVQKFTRHLSLDMQN